MKIVSLCLLSTLILAQNNNEAKSCQAKAMNNTKIKCRWVCDKKIYKEQKISEAISFYKKSKEYHFTKSGFNSFE